MSMAISIKVSMKQWNQKKSANEEQNYFNTF